MNVYIVTTPHGVQAVFDDYDQAAFYCAVREFDADLKIETWDTEMIQFADTKALLRRWIVPFDEKGNITERIETVYTLRPAPTQIVDDGELAIITEGLEVSIDQVREIALRCRREWERSE